MIHPLIPPPSRTPPRPPCNVLAHPGPAFVCPSPVTLRLARTPPPRRCTNVHTCTSLSRRLVLLSLTHLASRPPRVSPIPLVHQRTRMPVPFPPTPSRSPWRAQPLHPTRIPFVPSRPPLFISRTRLDKYMNVFVLFSHRFKPVKTSGILRGACRGAASMIGHHERRGWRSITCTPPKPPPDCRQSPEASRLVHL